MPREIITLQFGHFSNFIGTHFWNTQDARLSDPILAESMRLDVLYRSGETPHGELTYTPRVVIFDLKGSLGSLSRQGQLYSPSTETSAQDHWTGEVTTVVKDTYPTTEYHQYLEELETGKVFDEMPMFERMDSEVNVWSDFNGIYYHPRSVHELKHYQHNSTVLPFDTFIQGEDLARSEDIYEVFENDLRFFAEECDTLDGFQIFADTSNGFSGLSNGFMTMLTEEYPKCMKIVYGSHCDYWQKETERAHIQRRLNESAVMASVSDLCSLYMPLEIQTLTNLNPMWSKHLASNFSLPYHTSALIAAAIDTCLLPVLSNTYALEDICSAVNFRRDTQIANLNIQIPLALHRDASLSELSKSFQKGFEKSMLGISPSESAYAQSIFSRLPASLRPNGASSDWNVNDFLYETFVNGYKCSATQLVTDRHLFPTCAPFPRIFQHHFDKDGYYLSHSGKAPTQVPVLVRLETSSGVGDWLDQYERDLRKTAYVQQYRYMQDSASGTPCDEWNEMLDAMGQLSDAYIADE